MSERTDQHLLQLWANRADEIAFRAFADRYSGFVFGTARRRISDSSLAEEITQDVFAAAARQAAKLSSHVSVTAWLHRTTMLTVLDRMRRHARQRRKIEDLKAMHPQNPERDPWMDVLPQLDEALDRLRSADREILLLHFAERLPFPQVAARLGTTVDAARMRTNRALEHLSQLLRTAGVSVPVTALAASLSGTFVQAAPVSLVLSPVAMAGAGKVMFSTVVIHAFQGLKAVHVSAAALVSLVLAGVVLFQQKEIHSAEDRIAGLRASLPKNPTTSALDSNALAIASPASTSAQALDLRQLSLDALLGSYAGKNRIGATLARLDNNNLAGLLQTTLQGSLLPEPRRSLIVEILGEMERRSPALHLQTCLELMKTASADFFRDLGHRAQNSMQTWITKEPEAALAWARAQDGAWREAHQRYRTWDDPSLMNRITAGFLIRDPARGYAMLEEMNPLAIKGTLEVAVKDLPPGRLREIAEWGTQLTDVEKRRRIVRTSVRFMARDWDDKVTAFSIAGPVLQKLPLSDA
ncbi:MAG TPA: sigma-70 family RNA polymerase sigma factor, partial [Candidatus Kapabacteria bacterium]|nr:sigma-70 family RNA polymerase sigma factor [Candidatus Kapabacteria bacterium]